MFGIQIKDGSNPIPQEVVENSIDRSELYDWQRRAVDYFFGHDNCCLLSVVTGAGKTFCAIEIIKKVLEQDPDISVLVVVPKNVILETGWYKELYDAGIALNDIGIYYGQIKEVSKVTLTNMQSLHRLPLEIFDMVIFDEIHNYGTKRLMPFVKHKFKYKLGLSATIQRMDQAHWKLLEIFNFNVFKYEPKEALEDGVLNPFDFFNIGVDLDDEDMDTYEMLTQEISAILKAGGGFTRIMRTNTALKLKMLSKMNARKDLINNYYKKFEVAKLICTKHKNDKIIIFNQYNDQTNKFYWCLLDVGVKARIVHSGIKQDERDQILMDFKNDKFNVILVSKVLDEGYNLPKIDTAVIMAGDSTAKQTIQRMGRVLRKKKKSSNLYQVFCRKTVEETYADGRTKIFEGLCSDYKKLFYDGEVLV